MWDSVMELAEKLSEFGDDHVGGAKWLKDNFAKFPEPAKSQVYQLVLDRWDELPKEAQDILVLLAFQCEAGRKRMMSNIEHAASQLPDGNLKRNLIGDSRASAKEEKPIGKQLGASRNVGADGRQDAVTRLQTLKRMLDDKLISQQEFDLKKKAILDSI